MFDLVKFWDKSHSGIPNTKLVSGYAVEKEALFPRNSVVCDLGGGKGVDSIYFLQQGHKVVLVDISPLALDSAKTRATELGFNIETKQTDLGKDEIPLEDKSVDVLYSRLGVHYFNAKTTEHILKGIYRILKPNGVAYITVKSDSDAEEMQFLSQTAVEVEPGVYDDNGAIKSRYTIEQWERMLNNVGIKKYEVEEYLEKLQKGTDVIKSGKGEFSLTEIIIKA